MAAFCLVIPDWEIPTSTHFLVLKERLSKVTFTRFLAGNPLGFSSSVAFYLILSLPAILMIVISVAGSFFDDELVRQSIINQITDLFGSESAATVSRLMQNVQYNGGSFLSRAVSVGVIIFSSTTVLTSLQEGMNHVWGVKAKQERGWLKFLLNKSLSAALIISLGLLLVISLTLDATVTVLNENILQGLENVSFTLLKTINLTISFLITTGVIAVILKVLPEVHLTWKDVGPGAVITTLLVAAGKFFIALYLSGSTMGTAYGAAGSLVLFLIWVYYSTVILFFGAHFTFVYAMLKGRDIKPYERVSVVKEIEISNYDELLEGEL